MVEHSVEKLLANVQVKEVFGNLPKEVTGLHYHSGKIKEGNIFVAIEGEKVDGHAYIPEAQKRGASLFIVTKKQDVNIPQVLVEDSRSALAQVAANYFNHPSKKFTLVGITATNGKTSTAYILNHILEEAGLKTGIIGTVKVAYPGFSQASSLTTPQSYDLQEHFYHMAEAGIDVCVMEVSSSAQELKRVEACDFDLVSFHNLSREHIDQHGSFENYYRQKKKLITQVKEGALVLLNQDESLLKKLDMETKGTVVHLSYKGAEDAQVTYKDLDLTTGLAKFTYTLKESISFQKTKVGPLNLALSLGSSGYSSVMNSLVAVTLALALGIGPTQIQNALGTFRGVERRFECLTRHPFIILDDHFANVKNVEATLETIKHMDFNQLILVYAIRGNRGVHLNQETSVIMADLLQDLPLKGFFVSLSQDVVGEKDWVQDKEIDVFKETMDQAKLSYRLYPNLKDSIQGALDLAEPGDLVLFAGCQGMDKGAEILLSLGDQRLDLEALKALVSKRSC